MDMSHDHTTSPKAGALLDTKLARFASFASVILCGLFLLSTPSLSDVQHAPQAPVAQAWSYCRDAAMTIAAQENIPPALLSAVTRTEAGRRFPASGRAEAWPWVFNQGGRGHFFKTKEEAIQAVRLLLARGIRNIDVGCMQVNLRFHPRAFTSLEEAFDPLSNMAYGAHFLKQLQRSGRSWREALADYHSTDDDRGIAYRRRVEAIWREERSRLQNAPAAQNQPLHTHPAKPATSARSQLAEAIIPPIELPRTAERTRPSPIPVGPVISSSAFPPLRLTIIQP